VIEIRPAAPQDAPAVRALLGELGYEAAPEAIAYRLQRLNGTGSDPVFLARENGQPLALIALHHCHMLQYAKPIVRITALVVHHRARRSGIGRQLIDYTICWAKRAGCELVELTSALDRAEAHAFYRDLGFAANSLRFRKLLEG
jgi:GNAT superfamily N-acetyltransferase